MNRVGVLVWNEQCASHQTNVTAYAVGERDQHRRPFPFHQRIAHDLGATEGSITSGKAFCQVGYGKSYRKM